MLYFESDYMEGCHPAILKRLVETNLEHESGYGHDKFSDSAKELIKTACDCKDAQIQFVSGGTQTNQLVISTVLKPYEGVVAAQTGHVSTHEAGAIEYTGSKVLVIPGHEGKINASELDKFISDFNNDGNREHEVFPGMVYISQPTEYGTLYSKNELESISKTCHDNGIPLFMDGARLGYALSSGKNDLELKDIARLCDIFYIGGTKCGALIGEALVFTKNNMPAHFENLVKKHGALLAKGRLAGIQFETLFTDNLYTKICSQAVEFAAKIHDELEKKGYKFLLQSPTNQQFLIIENSKLEILKKDVKVSFWEKYDQSHTVVRIATSWATAAEDVEKFIGMF